MAISVLDDIKTKYLRGMFNGWMKKGYKRKL